MRIHQATNSQKITFLLPAALTAAVNAGTIFINGANHAVVASNGSYFADNVELLDGLELLEKYT